MLVSEAQELRRASYAWIIQDEIEHAHDDEAGEEPLFPERLLLDRVTVWWHARAESRWGHRSSYGPALTTLNEALRWARERTNEIVIRMGDVDFAPQRPRRGLPQWTTWPETTVAFDDLARSEWKIHWKLGLRMEDFELARPGFAERLASIAAPADVSVSCVENVLVARFRVLAPSEALAQHLGKHLGLQAATDVPIGLSDVLNGRLDVRAAST